MLHHASRITHHSSFIVHRSALSTQHSALSTQGVTMTLTSLFSLEGKVAIVTGGTGVLGGALARGLASAGARVGILGRRAQQGALVADQIGSTGGAALPLAADVLNRSQLEAARDLVLNTWGRIDI